LIADRLDFNVMANFRAGGMVLGVTGGVAAYKAAELARLLVKAGAEVHVVLTAAGAQFVTPATFQALTGRPVWQRAVGRAHGQQHGAHRPDSRGAAASLVAPATRRISSPSWRTAWPTTCFPRCAWRATAR
jgi:phosphopantothenoylcysteine decarboxylase/phosphopantothenate--cysteine ligase